MSLAKQLSIGALCTFAGFVGPSLVYASGPSDSPMVRIDSGVLHGQRDGAVDIFRGVPYAKPPIGSLRWKPPQPASWQGVRSAESYGPACLQQTNGNGVPNLGGYSGPTSEDCLTLNVWAPKHARMAPVMVWIHGGANRFSASSLPVWDGATFARDGVVLVSFNYRLAGLGYFAHPALTAEAGPHDSLGNYGLMDQIAVLRWVRRNIAAFGGDSKNVTVIGESSGGNQTLWLMTVASAGNLFQKAIVESAGGWIDPATLEQREQDGVKLAQRAGLRGGGVTAAALRALSADAFLDPSFDFDFEPFIDGRLVTETPAQAFARSHFTPRRLIIGFNSFEGSVMRGNALSSLGDQSRRLMSLYPSGQGDLSERQLWGDMYAGAPSRWIAGRSATRAPAYLYRFSYVPESERATLPGAPHGGELPYVFDSWARLTAPGGKELQLAAEDRAMTTLVHGCWVAFAKTGRPDCPQGPVWPEYSASGDHLMDFDGQSMVRSNVRKAQFDAIERALLPRALDSSNR
jgi:para-nitrobenzyl esterase